ncbi:MAG: protein kinase [Chloroflexota bacterium]|nr:protein kinase [Chloroflexota bacterium]
MPGETLLNQRYELVAQQGSGGMSVIYKSLDRMLGRMVAIKILRPSLTQDPAFLEKFQQEARSVAMMSHPNIVTVHDVGSDGHTHYIVMEMIEGHDLKKVIRARGALPLERALDYGIQICAGLGFAHRSQLVHADVKPQNILINRDGVIKVTDFGIAQAYTDTMPQTRSEVVWGSPHYFAPEQARGEKPSPASDVYSIGVVMFEMFTGRLPYIGASQRELALAHIQSEIPQASEINPKLPEEISNIIAKVMSKRPNDRYKHADQLGQILQRARERAKYAQMQAESGRMAAPPITGNPPVSSSAAAPASNPAPQASSFTPPPGAAAASPFPPLNPRPGAPAASSQPMANAAPSQPPASPPGQAASTIPGPPPAQFNPDGSRRLDATGSFTGPLLPQRQEKRNGLDLVTLILIALAFCAVAGLAPLYLFGVFPILS